MFNAAIQPTGVYSAFKRPNAPSQGSASLNTNIGANAANSSAANALNPSSASNQSPKENKTDNLKKSLKQRLPYLALLALAGSIGVIYGIPAIRLKFRKSLEKKSKNKDSIAPLITFKNKHLNNAATKIKNRVNKFVDTLEEKIQKNISVFLKENFFKY